MNILRVCLAQINPTVGALRANAERIADVASAAARQGADLVVFPALVLSGGPAEGLVQRPFFLADVERRLADLERQMPANVVVLVGAPRGAPDGDVFNSAWVFAGGRRVGCYDNMRRSNDGVFDEAHGFRPGACLGRLLLGPWRIGLHIGEDSCRMGGPTCAGLRGAVHGVANLSCFPYRYRKARRRERAMGQVSGALRAPLFCCNLVGGQDEQVFEGGSVALEGRRVLARAKVFEEDLLVVDVEPAAAPLSKAPAGGAVCRDIECPPPTARRGRRRHAARVEPRPPPEAEVYGALRLGLGDYARKNGFDDIVIGLSGGIDSALAAALAADALGPARVHGLSMPSRFTSAGSRRDARAVAEALGISFVEQSIERLHAVFLEELSPHWQGRAPDTTEENLQARIRGAMLMAFSNKFGWLPVATGNKSELATGYCTLYGDMAGGFAALKDVLKTWVYRLARWRNRQAPRPVIPRSIIRRAPSAELREHQKDQDTLPPYPLLDAILERYIERGESVERIVAEGFDADTVRRVARLVERSEYKRRQAAPGVQITPTAFGSDFRLPMTNAYETGVTDEP